MSLILAATLINVSHASALRDWWAGFCERHLIADYPYEYEQLTVDELVTVHARVGLTKVLKQEIAKRLAGDLSRDDREILTKLTGRE